MLNTLILALLAQPAPLVSQGEVDVRARFVEYAGKNDAASCTKLWRDHPFEVLGTIDADLEGALAAWEKDGAKADEAQIRQMHLRALWGAKLASETFATPIFLDYTSSFVGWNDEQKANFRKGQAAHGAARGALKKGDHAVAADKARECADLALPLGDWWGYSMGLAAEGLALAGSKQDTKAASQLSKASILYRDLGLIGAQRECVAALVSVCERSKQPERARAAAREWLALTQTLGDQKSLPNAVEALARCEEACGDAQAAKDLRAKLPAGDKPK